MLLPFYYLGFHNSLVPQVLLSGFGRLTLRLEGERHVKGRIKPSGAVSGKQ